MVVHDRSNMPNIPKALIAELMEMANEIITYLTEFDADFEAHTHNTDASATIAATLPGATAVVVTDDDSAASNGTPLYVVPMGVTAGPLAWFESTSANNADAVFHMADATPVMVVDSDAPGGVIVHFDEDAANVDERFLCVSPTGADLFVPLANGEVLKVMHDASAASNGVDVYFDDNGATEALRLLMVSPTDTVGAGASDDVVGFLQRAYAITPTGSVYTSVPKTDAATVDGGTDRVITVAVPTKISH